MLGARDLGFDLRLGLCLALVRRELLRSRRLPHTRKLGAQRGNVLLGRGGVSLKFGGGFPQYSILMYPDVFWCILRKYCILEYSDVFSNVFSYLVVCDRDTLCFMYCDVS